MALETNVDSLVLDIAVKDNENGESSAKKISQLDRVLVKFENTIAKLDTTMFKKKFQSLATSLRPFIRELKGAKAEITALERVLRKTGIDGGVKQAIQPKTPVGEDVVNVPDNTGGDIPSEKKGTPQKLSDKELALLKEITAANKQYTTEQRQNYGNLIKVTKDADGTTKAYFERYKDGKRILTTTTASFDKYGNIVKDSVKKVSETSENASKKGLSSFFRSLKRIALYRLIRTTLKLITSSMKEGIDNIVQFDESAKETMSEVTSSMTVMKNSVGVAIMPLLELVTPLIQGISKAVGTLANGISYLTAKLKGESTWLKVNTDYMKEYNKQSHLFSFDEFSTMSNTQDTSGMFTQEQMAGTSLGGILEDASALSSILGGIATTLAIIGASKIIGLVMDGTLKKGITGLGTSTLKFMGSVNGLAVGIGILVTGLLEFITNFDKMGTTAKILIPILAVLAAVLVGLAVAHAAAKAGIAAPAMAGITAAAIAAGIVLAAGTAIATAHENGGMMSGTGTLYHVAGERGAEIVAQGTRGTGVVNISQFKEAMIGALIEYGAAKNNSDGQEIVVNLDGKEIARLQATNNADALSQKYNVSFQPR